MQTRPVFRLHRTDYSFHLLPESTCGLPQTTRDKRKPSLRLHFPRVVQWHPQTHLLFLPGARSPRAAPLGGVPPGSRTGSPQVGESDGPGCSGPGRQRRQQPQPRPFLIALGHLPGSCPPAVVPGMRLTKAASLLCTFTLLASNSTMRMSKISENLSNTQHFEHLLQLQAPRRPSNAPSNLMSSPETHKH